jgi:AcrR family transcriptional regulator
MIDSTKRGPLRQRGRRSNGSADGDLSRADIIRCSLELIDEQGLDAFSVRAVAARLGIFPNAVLWHGTSREAILAGVTALALQDLARFEASGDWEQDVRRFGTMIRADIRCHPNIAPLIGSQLSSGGYANFPVVEMLLGVFARAGLEAEQLVAAYNVFVATVIGFVTVELASLPKAKDAWAKELRQAIETADPATYPLIAAHRAVLANNAFALRWRAGSEHPLDAAFDAALSAMVAGIRVTLIER